MNTLDICTIDSGNGDSIFLEHVDGNGDIYRGLIDANDYVEMRSAYTFLKRHFQRADIDPADNKHNFDFVLLSHPHLDHSRGLKKIISEFGAKKFYYPKSNKWAGQSTLINYANKSSKIKKHEHMDDSKSNKFAKFGDVKVEVLWPPKDTIYPSSDENNNSIILRLTYQGIEMVLGGDAEHDAWDSISNKIGNSTKFIKVPHHGSVNGTFGANNSTPWVDRCPSDVHLCVSCHVSPHGHPDQPVIDSFINNNLTYYRTDDNFHLIFRVENDSCSMKYSRF